MSAQQNPLKLYSCFHLNLAFSSIEGRERSRVLKQCYWPLLKMVQRLGLPIGIEANASTLEMIEDIDAEWIQVLRDLIQKGLVDFVGSGFVQLIAPLVPVDVNRANFRIGNDIYKDMLGVSPTIALVNEQAYSPGLVPLFKEAGYQAIIMDWANPYTHHKDWESDWLHVPQKVLGADGSTMDILWNDSIPFQKFQRYVYQELSLEDYILYLSESCSDENRAFPIYGSDIEIFNFRPNRYQNEEPKDSDEWGRIEDLCKALIKDPRFEFVTPSNILSAVPNGQNILSLESPDDPIPVKKQPKYNITRWAVSGRDDLYANTACWRLYERLKNKPEVSDEMWKSLCLKWRSDYRTHITKTRWNIYCWDMTDVFRGEDRRAVDRKHAEYFPLPELINGDQNCGDFKVSMKSHLLKIKTKTSVIVLNTRRGMSIHSYCVPQISNDMIYGTLPHGYYKDINWSSDFYSAHLVCELAGRSKVCDLERVDPEFRYDESLGAIELYAKMKVALGYIEKTIRIYIDKPRIDMTYELSWTDMPPGNLRLGHVTLNPKAFDRDTLYFETHNGGVGAERHLLSGQDVDHGGAVSFSTSARSGLGMTEGTLVLGDEKCAVEVFANKAQSALIGMVECKTVGDDYFCRASLSACELDETSRNDSPVIDIDGRNRFECSILVIDPKS